MVHDDWLREVAGHVTTLKDNLQRAVDPMLASSAVVAAVRPQVDVIMHRVSAINNNEVQVALAQVKSLSQPLDFPGIAPLAEFNRVWQPSTLRWFGSRGRGDVYEVGYPDAPAEILDIMNLIAEMRLLPRLRGLKTRVSRVWTELYDALAVYAQQATDPSIGDPIAIPRRYLRGQSERSKILRVDVISPHKSVASSIGHLQIRAPGIDDLFVASRSSLVLDGETKWKTARMMSGRRLMLV